MAAPFPHELGIGTNKWKLKHIDEVQATFGAALDAGISLFDTAQCYASSEACLGYVRKRDREPFIVTKFDSLRGGPDRLIPTLRKSLFDLDLECVDAYLVHFPRGDIDALAAALAEAVELGLTKRVGCSNFGRAEMLALRRALQKRGVSLDIVEIEFSLLRRRTEALVTECLKLNITVLAWAPLGSGRLVHTCTDARTRAVAGMLDVIAAPREDAGAGRSQLGHLQGRRAHPRRADEGAGRRELRRGGLAVAAGRRAGARRRRRAGRWVLQRPRGGPHVPAPANTLAGVLPRRRPRGRAVLPTRRGVLSAAAAG